jgi:hypothetical protein
MLVSHAGVLPRPSALDEVLAAEGASQAGMALQIDDPDLPDGWQAHPEMDLAAYRSYAALHRIVRMAQVVGR